MLIRLKGSIQGILQVNDNLKGNDTIYLTIADIKHYRKRTFKIKETVNLFTAKSIEGFFISSSCPECNNAFMVQIFRGKNQKEGWSYNTPLQDCLGPTVEDISTLEGEKE